MWDISQLRLNVRALTFNGAISNYNFPQYPAFVMKLLIVFALTLLSTFAAAADPHSDPVPTTKCSVPTDDRAIRAIADEMKNAYNAAIPKKLPPSTHPTPTISLSTIPPASSTDATRFTPT
jgi:hypothetical protein